MKISDGEKLIILMLTELYEKLGVEGEIDPDFIKSAIFSQNLWGIPWKYPGIPFDEQNDPAIVKEVLDILDMWSTIEHSYERFTPEERDELIVKAGLLGKEPKFKGFDGNNESEYMGAALFIVNDLNRFEEFKGRSLNSHCPFIDAYNRMLPLFEQLCSESYDRLTVEDISSLLLEIIHPSNRRNA